jgi:hypothetical protein
MQCGGKVEPAGAESIGVPMICSHCQTPLKTGAKFCSSCGASTGYSAPPVPAQHAHVPPRLVSVATAAPTNPPTSTSHLSNAQSSTLWKEPPVARGGMPPPPPPVGQVFTFRISNVGIAGAPFLPQPGIEEPSPALLPGASWAFQDQTTAWAAQLLSKLNASGMSTSAGLGATMARMIRAALVDKTIYREVASNDALQKEAWTIAGLVVVLGSFGLSLLSLQTMSLPGLASIVSLSVIQLTAWLVGVWAVQITASTWLKSPTTFNQMFRALAYAQSAGCLRIVPVVGQLIGLWCLVTNTAAIRDVTGCSTEKAIVLTVVGIVAGAVAAAFVGPLIWSL